MIMINMREMNIRKMMMTFMEMMMVNMGEMMVNMGEMVMVLLPVPKLSSPQRAIRPASSKVPKYFHPVGVSKHSNPRASATLIKTN